MQITDNLHIYNQSRAVPEKALKEIKGGRLSGKSDINPMWRIKQLTELFGPCGIGWKYIITKQWLERGGNDEVSAFVNIDLFIKYNEEWSEAIPGTGGSSFIAKEKNGLYTSDECFKMALTDAISVSCKALGFGADVYWDKDVTKYSKSPQQAQPIKAPQPAQPPQKMTADNWKRFWDSVQKLGYESEEIVLEKAGVQTMDDLIEWAPKQVTELYNKLKEEKQVA